jgi:hypothetical protein
MPPIRKRLAVKEDLFRESYVGEIKELECIPGRPKSAMRKGWREFVEEYYYLSGHTAYQAGNGLLMTFWEPLILYPYLEYFWLMILALFSLGVLSVTVLVMWWKIPSEDRLLIILNLEQCEGSPGDPENPMAENGYNFETEDIRSTPLLSASIFA